MRPVIHLESRRYRLWQPHALSAAVWRYGFAFLKVVLFTLFLRTDEKPGDGRHFPTQSFQSFIANFITRFYMFKIMDPSINFNHQSSFSNSKVNNVTLYRVLPAHGKTKWP